MFMKLHIMKKFTESFQNFCSKHLLDTFPLNFLIHLRVCVNKGTSKAYG